MYLMYLISSIGYAQSADVASIEIQSSPFAPFTYIEKELSNNMTNSFPFRQETRNFKTVFGIGIDPKMAIVGPHPDRPDNKPSLDYEVSFGFEWENTRLLMQVKSHKKVNFFKWTYMQFDYKKEVFSNVYLYSGLEISEIRKSHDDYNYLNDDNYRAVTINPIVFGANLEVQFKMLDDKFGIGLQGSIYESEDELKKYKKYRKEVTLNAYFYF